MWARIEQGRVREITSQDPAGRYHPDLKWLPAADDVTEGMMVQDGAFLPAPARVPSADDVRQRRERILQASDWTQVPDNGMADDVRAGWRAYRQALRDAPKQPGFPSDVTWPTPPMTGNS